MRNILNFQIEKKVIKLYKSGLNQIQVSKKTSLCRSSVRKILSKYNLLRIRRNYYYNLLNSNDYKDIVYMYSKQNKSSIFIGRKYGLSIKSVMNILRKNGIEKADRNRYATFDCSFFEKIDTEEKAYILGFYYADGYNDEMHGRIMLDLQEKDIDILRKIKKIIKYTGKIRIYMPKKKKMEDELKKEQNLARLRIYNKKTSKDLAALGCFQNKSLTLRFPTERQVPICLLRHFIRGYFDGDGCFSCRKDSYHACKFSINSTKHFCSYVNKYVNDFISIGTKKIYRSKRTPLLYEYCLCGANQVKAIMDWLYKDANIYLSRKYKKYHKWKSYHKMMLSMSKKSVSCAKITRLKNLKEGQKIALAR